MSSASPQRASDAAVAADAAANLSKSSQPWTEADSAAGFVLRYLVPMREQLIERLESEAMADDCLKLLIGHLVSQGFGAHGKGRIRDFLLRGIRSAAKAAIAEMPADQRVTVDFSTWTTDAKSWLEHWRAAILARVWRALERQEHRNASEPLFTILRSVSAHPRETAAMLAVRINTESDVSVDAEMITRLLPQARKRFAQILLSEVGETLDKPDEESIQSELQTIGLAEVVGKLRAGE